MMMMMMVVMEIERVFVVKDLHQLFAEESDDDSGDGDGGGSGGAGGDNASSSSSAYTRADQLRDALIATGLLMLVPALCGVVYVSYRRTTTLSAAKLPTSASSSAASASSSSSSSSSSSVDGGSIVKEADQSLPTEVMPTKCSGE